MSTAQAGSKSDQEKGGRGLYKAVDEGLRDKKRDEQECQSEQGCPP